MKGSQGAPVGSERSQNSICYCHFQDTVIILDAAAATAAAAAAVYRWDHHPSSLSKSTEEIARSLLALPEKGKEPRGKAPPTTTTTTFSSKRHLCWVER